MHLQGGDEKFLLPLPTGEGKTARPGRTPELFLAARAKESRAAVLHDALDRAFASRRDAGLALAVIDAEIVLEIAERAVGAPMIAQRRAARLDRIVEHGSDRVGQRNSALVRRAGFAGDGESHALGRQPRAMQRLADIDIAQPGNHALIAERGLQRGLLALAG